MPEKVVAPELYIAIGISGAMFYTGDRFPQWRGNLFVGGMAGERLVRLTLERSREEMLRKSEEETGESAGPPVLGYRLTSSRNPTGVDLVMYKKGTWIIHMLRQLMRDPKTGSDAGFFKFLRSVRDTFEQKPLTTAEFRRLAE